MADKTEKPANQAPSNEPISCGLVMPISAIDGCSATHWADVRAFITNAIEGIDSPKFSAKLVSEEEDAGLILKSIVQNVYNSDIVVCDVSGKNPNVMFEVGMRFAFDRPMVIIKDDATSYSFDTSGIEHLEYPRDLRYPSMIEFGKKLKAKVAATYSKSQEKGYDGLLKNFGTFKVAHLEERTGNAQEAILEQIKELTQAVAQIQRSLPPVNALARAMSEAQMVAQHGIGSLGSVVTLKGKPVVVGDIVRSLGVKEAESQPAKGLLGDVKWENL